MQGKYVSLALLWHAFGWGKTFACGEVTAEAGGDKNTAKPIGLCIL